MTSPPSKTWKSPSTSKFLPNLKQLHEAISELPDASDYKDENFTSLLSIGSKSQQITFTKKQIQRGSQLVHRWIYEGKILIRNQDQESIS